MTMLRLRLKDMFSHEGTPKLLMIDYMSDNQLILMIKWLSETTIISVFSVQLMDDQAKKR